MGQFNTIKVAIALVAILHGSIGLELFETGKEYNYQYLGLFTTGTEEPVSHASSYKLRGKLRIQGTSSDTLSLKMEDVSIGMYNGKWSYFPTPDFQYLNDDRFAAFQEPFQIVLTNEGKFKTLIMNDQEPEYASNLKRGLATYLQLNMTSGFDRMQVFKDLELTTMGECSTSFEITPKSPVNGLVKVAKFRNHADCPDIPTRTRYGNKAYYRCSNEQTRDVLNSTAYTVYDISLDGSKPTINTVTVLSSILYWPFTSKGQFLYTWYNLTLSLDSVSSIANPIPPPENAENHEDLSFVFEQSDYQDPEEDVPDPKLAEPFFFHQTTTELDADTLSKASQLVETTISEVVTSLNSSETFEDVQKFHGNSPLRIALALSPLDYESLKVLYSKYSSGDPLESSELQLFIDGLVLTGSTATSLMIRDILLETTSVAVFARILPSFPQYIRNPSETLAKELDAIFEITKKATVKPSMKRQIELAMATVISRCCEKNLCANSGLLDKYITYFETKLSSQDDFSEQTTAVLGLRNLRVGRSLNKVLEIALGNSNHNRAVRVQAIWSLRPLLYSENSHTIQRALMEVFFNRNESCEIRTSVFGLLVGATPEKRILHEIAYFMWSETCPQTLNIVRSTLALMAKSKSPCNNIGSYAQTILKYLPPGEIDFTRTTTYKTDFLDEDHGFGRSTYAAIQKSGKTSLPISMFVGSSDTIGGFSSSQIGVFMRLQGLESASSTFADDDSAEDITADKIVNILTKLKVENRPSLPVQLELTILYSDRVIWHYAADSSNIASITQELMKMSGGILKLLQRERTSWERSILLGEILYQQPLELGIPSSIYASGAYINRINGKISLAKGEADVDLNNQFNIFAKTMISNHVPVLGTMHTAGFSRTLRLRFPQRLSIKSDGAKKKYIFTAFPPTETNPFIIQNHATAFTLVRDEQPYQQNHVELLKSSCPTCSDLTVVSKGAGLAKSEVLRPLPSFIKGMQGGIKSFHCERDSLKVRGLRKLREYFSDKGKNTGLLSSSTSKFLLAIQNTEAYIFFWPNPEPCGFTYSMKQNNESAPRRLEKIETAFQGGYVADASNPADGTLTLGAKMKITYQGSSASSKTYTLQAKTYPEKAGLQVIQIKGTVSGDAIDYNGALCLDINNQASVPASDPLGFDNENEPVVNQTINLRISKLPAGDGSGQCSGNHVDITLKATARRSGEQVARASSPQPPNFDYLFCLIQKTSGAWPKNYHPPTRECKKVLVDQTALRTINVTINYKVAEEVKKRWARPASFIGNLLSLYSVDPEDDKVHVHSSDHSHDGTAAAATNANLYEEGEVEIDADLKYVEPSMDIHYIGSSGVEQHFHDIEVNLIPEPLRIQPTESRQSGFELLLAQFGFIGSCAITPSQVVTFDNLPYPAALTECDTLLSAYCGDTKEIPKFAVTGRRIGSSKLAVDIYLQNSQVSISGGKVLIDSKPIAFNSNGEYKLKETQIMVRKQGKDIFVESLTVGGVEVRYADGYFVDITAGSRYRGTTCGLCGNFDTTSSNDLIGPKNPTCPLSSMISAWSTGTQKSCSASSTTC